MEQNTPANKSILYFSIASLVFGIFSLISCVTVIIPLVAGGLSVLFYALSKRQGQPATTMSMIGLIMAIMGIMIGIALIFMSVFLVFIPMLGNAELYREYDTLIRNYYGIPLSDYIRSIYPDFVEPTAWILTGIF